MTTRSSSEAGGRSQQPAVHQAKGVGGEVQAQAEEMLFLGCHVSLPQWAVHQRTAASSPPASEAIDMLPILLYAEAVV
jgi:hypothetical protein